MMSLSLSLPTQLPYPLHIKTPRSSHQIPNKCTHHHDLLKSYIRTRNLTLGRDLHQRLLTSTNAPLDPVLCNSLITLYSKCGRFDWASQLFEDMSHRRDLVSWTAMISAAAQNNRLHKSFVLFRQLLHSGFSPNEFTFAIVFQACAAALNLEFGLMVLALAIKTGFWDANVSVGSALIDLFAKVRDMVSARKVFDGMTERNLVVWTLMITRLGQSGLEKEAIDLFLEMGFEGFEPDMFTMSSAISACIGLGSILLGQQLHSLVIRNGLLYDVCVGCSVVDMYAKCGSIGDSRKAFDQMIEHNVMSWTAIISGYVRSGLDAEAIMLFIEMIHGRVRPNHFTYSSVLKACSSLSDGELGEQAHAHVIKSSLSSVNFVGNALVSMYSRSGRMEEARKAFEVLFEKNLVSYNTIVDGYVKNANSEEAFELFHLIENSDIGANAFTFASLLSAAASMGMMGKGQQLHGQIVKSGLEVDICIKNALVSMYSRCGSIEDASKVFQGMGERNVISWTSMITGYAKHGCAAEALQLFDEMVSEGIRPNEVTYVAVLSACSHVGLVQDGKEHFKSMKRDHGIEPRMEHYACMADLLGRSGLLDDAIVFIRSMPFKADALVWRTLLSACSVHGNVEQAEIAAENVLTQEPDDPAAYVLLSNLYAKCGKWGNVAEIRRGMKERRLSKEAGLSWVEVENSVHKFHVGDTSHPRAHEIFKKLDELVHKIKAMGYVADTGVVLHDVEDEHKEQYLLQHSEKIAVAFGLISTSARRPIRVFKNLRVCGDCHNAIKLISKATGREIIVRDSNRFHRFSDGECTCREYW